MLINPIESGTRKPSLSQRKSMPRVVVTQIHRSNTPAESMLDYYKTKITITLLDHLICELNYRFNSS